MKPYLILLLFGASLLLLSDCKKETRYVVKGRVMDSCFNGNPVDGVEFELQDLNRKKGELTIFVCSKHFRAFGNTNANGEFRLEYEHGCYEFVTLKLKKQGMGSVGWWFPPNQNIDLGDIVFKNNLKYFVVLTTDTAYSNQDTLFFNIKQVGFRGDSTFKFLTGPFTNNQFIDTVITTKHSDFNKTASIDYHWILKSGKRIYRPIYKTSNPGIKTNPVNLLGDICSDSAKIELYIGR